MATWLKRTIWLLALVLREEEMFIISQGVNKILMLSSLALVESRFFKGMASSKAIVSAMAAPPPKRKQEEGEEDEVMIIEQPPPPPTNKHIIVSAIDPGSENMAIAQWNNGKFKEAGRSLHVTQDGRMFDLKESNLSLLTLQWVMAHQDFWRDSEFIYIEWQFSKDQSKNKEKERTCLLIKMSLESIFLTLYMRGEGPKPVCKVASWWKNRVGVEVGGSNHDGNKLRAIDVFRDHPETGGEAAIQHIIKKFGKKHDDPIEASLMCLALKDEVPNLRKQGCNFHSTHSQHNGKKRFKEEERWFPLLSHAEPDPMCQRAAYAEFKDKRKDENKVRKQKRLLQNL